ncbi:MAG TPA: PQQ-binding-like beta-propeller repeat protein [Jatrophihabitantaceae bacterium]
MTDTDQRAQRSGDELRRYVGSMRRQRRWYFAAIAVVAAVALAVVLVVWFTGEITHVHLRTAKSAPPNVPAGTPPPAPTRHWQSSDTTAIGTPFVGGTVVTYSKHAVTGRRALTGVADWTYTRTDRSVCQVLQLQGKTIAVYENGGNCDEVSTFETDTGQRAWTRTLDENGLAVDGHPAMIATADTFYVWSAQFVYAIDPVSGYDRWTYPAAQGCTLTSVVPGSSGVLMSSRCANGNQLFLRDRTAGIDDKQQTDDKKNQVLWRLPNTNTVPVAADAIVAALDPTTHQLVTYHPAKGKVQQHITLTPAPTATSPVLHAAATEQELLWIAGTSYALDGSGTQLWSAPTSTLPTLNTPDGGAPSSLTGAVILVPTSSGVAVVDGATGKITAQYSMPPPAPESRVYSVGDGLLVAGSSTAYYA